MPADRIGGHTTKNTSHIGVESVSFGQAERVLRFQRVCHVVALQLFFLIVEEHCGIGSAFHIREAQRSASTHNAGPVAASGNVFFPYMCVLLLHDLIVSSSKGFSQLRRLLLIRIYGVAMQRILPNTRGTAHSCHQGALGETAYARGQAMLTNSNTDQMNAVVLIISPQTPNFNAPSAGFQRPVRRVYNPIPVVMANMAYNPPVPKAITVATAPSFSPNSSPSPASSTTQITALRGILEAVTRLNVIGILPSRAMEYTMRDVYCTIDAPHAR